MRIASSFESLLSVHHIPTNYMLCGKIGGVTIRMIGGVTITITTAISRVPEAKERAMMLMDAKEFLICGGVAQSQRLKEMADLMCKSHGARFGVAADEYNADNGAMIAIVAEKMFRSGYKPATSACTVKQRYRIDEAKVTWQ